MLLNAKENLASSSRDILNHNLKDLNITLKKFNYPKIALKELQSKNRFVLINGKDLYAAYKGQNGYTQADKKLRSIMALYKLKVTLIAQKAVHIAKMEELKGKKIAFLGEMSLSVTKPVLDALKLSTKGDVLDLNQSIHALKNKEIDILFMLSTDNSPALHQILETTDTHLQSLKSKTITQLIRSSDVYSKAKIPKELDKHINSDIITVGVKMILATSANSDKALVYALTRKILQIFDQLKKRDPLYRNLSRKSALEELAIPQHSQAIKAFNETPDR